MKENKNFQICNSCQSTEKNADCALNKFWDSNIRFQNPVYLLQTIEDNEIYSLCPNKQIITKGISKPISMRPSKNK